VFVSYPAAEDTTKIVQAGGGSDFS
jgi:hypothetical protein